VSSVPHRRYRRVAVVAWDCLVGAGDARAAWLACTRGASALRHDDAIGWHGAIGLPRQDLLLRAALGAAGVPWTAIAGLPGDLALSVGSSKGDPLRLADALAGDARALLEAMPGQLSPRLARALGLGAHRSIPVAAACSTGLYAVLAAADLIEDGGCQRALAGAADCSLSPLLLAGFASLGVLCGPRRPQAFAVPTGFAPAEGAGFLALAHQGPWRLCGGVRLGDAGHETSFTDPRTLAACLQALWEILPEPELIVTHGTGTAGGDAYERAGLDAGPWAAAPRLHCKPVIGHCLGASGAVELALALESPARRLWKLSLGFGGHLAAVALAR
jgi:hypothetical protein